jgi:hypothetical protein
MAYCAVDQTERDDSNAQDFRFDAMLGWVHRVAGSWHTVAGTPLVCEEGELGPRFTVVQIVVGVPTPAAMREDDDA